MVPTHGPPLGPWFELHGLADGTEVRLTTGGFPLNSRIRANTELSDNHATVTTADNAVITVER